MSEKEGQWRQMTAKDFPPYGKGFRTAMYILVDRYKSQHVLNVTCEHCTKNFSAPKLIDPSRFITSAANYAIIAGTEHRFSESYDSSKPDVYLFWATLDGLEKEPKTRAAFFENFSLFEQVPEKPKPVVFPTEGRTIRLRRKAA